MSQRLVRSVTHVFELVDPAASENKDHRVPIAETKIRSLRSGVLARATKGEIAAEEAARHLLIEAKHRLVAKFHQVLGLDFAAEVCRHDDYWAIQELDRKQETLKLVCVSASSPSVSKRGFEAHFTPRHFADDNWVDVMDAWLRGFEGLDYAVPLSFDSLTLEFPRELSNSFVAFDATLPPLDGVTRLTFQLSKFFTLAENLDWNVLRPMIDFRINRFPGPTREWLQAVLKHHAAVKAQAPVRCRLEQPDRLRLEGLQDAQDADEARHVGPPTSS